MVTIDGLTTHDSTKPVITSFLLLANDVMNSFRI